MEGETLKCFSRRVYPIIQQQHKILTTLYSLQKTMFRTELHPEKSDFQLDLNQPLITVGSCFSEVIGTRFEENKFPVLANPFGVIFHPGIACELLQMALAGKAPSEDTFVELEGRWVCYLLHSRISATSPEALQEKLQAIFREVNTQLRQARVLMLTSGTAFIYEHKNLQRGVANCHKQAQKNFRKTLSTPEGMMGSFEDLHKSLKKVNPSIQTILTVSPVRHLKDTLELNSVSKSILRLLAHQICERYQDVSYFPSYELLLDDLRDYRFYGRDLLHPNEEAEDYIWEKFINTYLSQQAKEFLKEWQGIRRALSHRPFNPASEAHQAFIRKTILKLEGLPYEIDIRPEINQLKSQLL